MLLRSGERPLETENVFERMGRTPLYYSAKITLFIAHSYHFCKKVEQTPWELMQRLGRAC